MRRLLQCAAILALTVSSAACQKTTTVVLVRHAERGPGTDPDLTTQGEVRAGVLADVLSQARVSVIFHTQFKRTSQTADSLAAQQNIPKVEFPVAGNQVDEHAAELVSEILDNYAGRTVLVIGHSNTVPLIIEELGATTAPVIPDTVFDNLFVVVKRSGSAARLIHARYGQ